MATLVLAAAGAAAGDALGGSLLGWAAAGIGRAVGGLAGQALDQLLFGQGARAVNGPRPGLLRLPRAAEGAAIPRLWGRMRLSGHLIWSTRFRQTPVRRSNGKGSNFGRATDYSYSVSCALALCEGPITRIGRVWADGKPFDLTGVEWRLYTGTANQSPDPLISAVEGAAPSYQGIAYVVFQDLPLEPYGNRMPQFSFEVFRDPPGADASTPAPLPQLARAVALSPGTGEFSLATTPVRRVIARGVYEPENTNTAAARPDLLVALDQLQTELPHVESVSLIVSWYGTDLRLDHCQIRPGVETRDKTTTPFVWRSGGVTRADAHLISKASDGRPNFGATPADVSVIEAIREIRRRGLKVMLYPFILMDIPAGNSLPNPWGDGYQPAFPWRGRLTLPIAPGQAGSVDKTASAATLVAQFFGQAQPSHFARSGHVISYSGPAEWSYRRFILHMAQLAVAAGGVDRFCIGSEMRSLTQIRSGISTYPAVAALVQLAADVRSVVGPSTQLGYAADWSEYFGHHPADGTGDVHFHLDPLWASPNINFIGIDNYMPLADWRAGDNHLDAAAGAKGPHDIEYLQANITGGEGWHWYYPTDAARRAQNRVPITDGAYGEAWVFRYKALVDWWSKPHHNRPGGVRSTTPTAWQPQSKPVIFTELGCPAVDLGANQPNVFVDPKSTESALPWFSAGVRDDLGQIRFLQAVLSYWNDPAHNPVSTVYGGRMLDTSATHLWTWDSRPWPDFPGRLSLWADGTNHRLGHWLTGRVGAVPLADTVADILRPTGVAADVSDLSGSIDGILADRPLSARALLQPLAQAAGFDLVDDGAMLRCVPRGKPRVVTIDSEDLVSDTDPQSPVRITQQPLWQVPATLRLSYIDSASDYRPAVAQADADGPGTTEDIELPLALRPAEAQQLAERLLAEARVARETLSVTLPPDQLALHCGDVLALAGGYWRIDRLVDGQGRQVEATRVDPALHQSVTQTEREIALPQRQFPVPVVAQLLDLPLRVSTDRPAAPWVAVSGTPWPGTVGVWRSDDGGESYPLDTIVTKPAVIGETVTALGVAPPHLLTRGQSLDVRIPSGQLLSRHLSAVLAGANLAALSTPSGWEVVQFTTATLVGPQLWRLSGLLRGQAGTEPLIAPLAPGADFVLLDDAVVQTALTDAPLGAVHSYRVAASHLGSASDLALTLQHSTVLAGLRPWAPAGLRLRHVGAGKQLLWMHRSRHSGDGWEGGEPPLTESPARYRLRLYVGGVLRRTIELTTTEFIYTPAQQSADDYVPGAEWRVAAYGPGYGWGAEGVFIDHG